MLKRPGIISSILHLSVLQCTALDEDNFVAMASIDLSAAFDVVEVALLIKRMKIMGLPADVIRLVELYLYHLKL